MYLSSFYPSRVFLLILPSSLILSIKLINFCRGWMTPTLSTQSHCSHDLLPLAMRSCTSCTIRETKHYQEDWTSFQYHSLSSNTVSVSTLLLCVQQQERKMKKIPPSSFTKGFKYEPMLAYQSSSSSNTCFRAQALRMERTLEHCEGESYTK